MATMLFVSPVFAAPANVEIQVVGVKGALKDNVVSISVGSFVLLIRFLNWLKQHFSLSVITAAKSRPS
jgi:hypothetical protein